MAELRQEVGAGATEIPWGALVPHDGLRGMIDPRLVYATDSEHRADAATPIPADVEATQQEIVRRVFARTVATWLGVTMTNVVEGNLLYYVLTAGQTPEFKSKSAAKESAAGTFASHTLKPKALQSSFNMRREELVQARGLENAFRADLAASMTDAYDSAIINGGADPNIPGLIHSLTAETAPTAEVTFAGAIAQVGAAVDGLYAQNEQDVRILVGPATYTKMLGLIQSNTAMTLPGFYRRDFGGIRTSANMPGMVSNTKLQTAIYAKTGGNRGPNAAAATWSRGVTVIRDELSPSNKREIKLTMVSMHDMAVLREAAYVEDRFKLA